MFLQDASLWSAASGTIKLVDYAQAQGLDLSDWMLDEVVAASDDGDVLAGIGTHRVGTAYVPASWVISGLAGPIFVDGFDSGD
jgi:hypothetical protein